MKKPKKRKPGRPKGTIRKEETVVMRIPISKVKAVKKLIGGAEHKKVNQ